MEKAEVKGKSYHECDQCGKTAPGLTVPKGWVILVGDNMIFDRHFCSVECFDRHFGFDEEKEFAPGEKHLRNIRRYLGKSIDECEATDCEKECNSGEEEKEETPCEGCVDYDYLVGRLDEKEVQMDRLVSRNNAQCDRLVAKEVEIRRLKQILEKAHEETNELRLEKMVRIAEGMDGKLIASLQLENNALKERLEARGNAMCEIKEILDETK